MKNLKNYKHYLLTVEPGVETNSEQIHKLVKPALSFAYLHYTIPDASNLFYLYFATNNLPATLEEIDGALTEGLEDNQLDFIHLLAPVSIKYAMEGKL